MISVTVIGGGWSAGQIDLARLPGTVIGVNDAALVAPRCDVAVSMDRLWTEYRWGELRERRMPAYIRRSATKNVDTRWPWCHVFECDHCSTEFSDSPGTLNGTHSGFCALNLAWKILRARAGDRRLFLLGFDMQSGPNGESHWYPPYPWARPGGATTGGKFNAWARQFAKAAASFQVAGVAVSNVSSNSAVREFAVMHPNDFAGICAGAVSEAA